MGRFEDAATEVRSHEKSEAWIDLAVFSLAATGADVEAKEYVEWAKELSTVTFWQRSAIGHYDGTMSWVLQSRSEREPVIPGTLSASERSIYNAQLKSLRPFALLLLLWVELRQNWTCS